MRSYPEIDPRAVWGIILSEYRSNNPVLTVTEPQKVESGMSTNTLHYGEAAVLTHEGYNIETGWDKEDYFVTPTDVSAHTTLTESESKSILYEMSNIGVLSMHKHGDENDGTPLFLPAPIQCEDVVIGLGILADQMEEYR